MMHFEIARQSQPPTTNLSCLCRRARDGPSGNAERGGEHGFPGEGKELL
jgi:hypothetical protein